MPKSKAYQSLWAFSFSFPFFFVETFCQILGPLISGAVTTSWILPGQSFVLSALILCSNIIRTNRASTSGYLSKFSDANYSLFTPSTRYFSSENPNDITSSALP